jgi:hypothetical protein
MHIRLLIHEEIVYEGEDIAIPRVDEMIRHGGEFEPIEAVTWDFRDTDAVTVTLVVGSRPYTF